MMEEKNKPDINKDVVIILNDSTYAHAFEEGNRVHQNEFERTIKLIDGQTNGFATHETDNGVLCVRYHNTISVFGGRGTGKTSFLYSILNHYRPQNKKDDLMEILGIIDPTILEEKGHIFLYIISLINEHVCKYLNVEDCNPDADSYIIRKEWKMSLARLAKGLPALDSLGSDYRNTSWEDDDFIMEKGLEQVDAALHIEKSFHQLVEKALNILGKKFFMLAFDDIDVDMKKGWPILECIRKYLTTPRIITLLSGNLKFYSNNIRIQQWKQLENLVKYEADCGKDKFMMDRLNAQVNEIEEQYLIKILKAENRIHLHSVNDAIRTYKVKFLVKETVETKNAVSLEDRYRELLNGQGIWNSSSVEIFLDYLLGLPVRTQINILKGKTKDENSSIREGLDVFLSKMYASKIDYELMVNNPKMCNVVILDYLVRKKILTNSYLLLPNDEDESINACVTGLTFIFMEKQRNNPFLLFDYMLRIGYVRNILLVNNDYNFLTNMCLYTGAYQDVSLKNFVGMSMGYLASNKEYSLKEHAAVYGLSVKAKEKRDEEILRIDEVFKADGIKSARRLIGFIPLCSLKYAGKNESRLYYSLFNLLAAIGQILKNGINENEISAELDKLQLLRSYSIFSDNTKTSDLEEELDFSEKEDDDNDHSKDNLTAVLHEWKNKNAGNILPPYAIGRIISRFYATASRIRKRKLGVIMNQYVITFLNACLIEEAHEIHEYQKLKLNVSNARDDNKIFVDNLKKISNAKCLKYIPFTIWLSECPLIQAFLDPNLWKDIDKDTIKKNKYFDDNSIFDILNRVGLKDDVQDKKENKDEHFAQKDLIRINKEPKRQEILNKKDVQAAEDNKNE